MLYNSVSFLGKGWASYAFLAATLLLLTSHVNGQYVPTGFSHGDTIARDFSYGPATAEPTLVLVYDYSLDGFSIDPASTITIEVEASPFGENTTLTTSYGIDHELERITVTLTRADGVPTWIDGWVCQVTGIIVVIDDVQPRMADSSLSALPSSLSIYPNPASHVVYLKTQTDKQLTVEIISLSGLVVSRVVVAPFQQSQTIYLDGIKPGIYYIRALRNDHLLVIK